jgi:hypothetical protein
MICARWPAFPKRASRRSGLRGPRFPSFPRPASSLSALGGGQEVVDTQHDDVSPIHSGRITGTAEPIPASSGRPLRVDPKTRWHPVSTRSTRPSSRAGPRKDRHPDGSRPARHFSRSGQPSRGTQRAPAESGCPQAHQVIDTQEMDALGVLLPAGSTGRRFPDASAPSRTVLAFFRRKGTG